MIGFRLVLSIGAVGFAAITLPKPQPDRCRQQLEQFRDLAPLVLPHITPYGVKTHDIAGIVMRYRESSRIVSSVECVKKLEFLPAGEDELKHAFEEARRMNFVLEHLKEVEALENRP